MGNHHPGSCLVCGDDESGWLFNVLVFCDDRSRYNCMFTCKRYSDLLSTDSAFQWRIERLHIERGIYSPVRPSSGSAPSRKRLFLELYKRRNLWTPSNDNTMAQGGASQEFSDDNGAGDLFNDEPQYAPERSQRITDNFNIFVSVRFKPLNSKTNEDSLTKSGKAILPLHQRLALIRLGSNAKSINEALGILKGQGRWFKDKWELIEMEEEDDCRLRDEATKDNKPAYKGGDFSGLNCGLQKVDPACGRVLVVDQTRGLREFEFDRVFTEAASQQSVYEHSVRRLVCDFINGFNATCLVYGQTSSGKTFTMFGPHDSGLKVSNLSVVRQGVVPRACSELLNAIEYRRHHLNLTIDASMSVSYVEIFGQEIADLLKQGKLCGHSKVSAQRYVLSGAAEVPIRSIGDVFAVLDTGERQKRKAATAMNERSSRAHTIFIVTLKQKCVDSGVCATSRLFLADLGGSEQTKKSQISSGKSNHIEAQKCKPMGDETNLTSASEGEGSSASNANEHSVGFVKSDRMREAVNINLGLMSLKNCVKALTSGEVSPYVPYADSKLTMMLSSGLGGNSKTSVIVCSAQEEQHATETLQALKFGQACRKITKSVRTGANLLQEMMSQLDADIAACEETIRAKERWEFREETRVDLLAERDTVESLGFGGIEVKKTTVLVGAEEDRKLLSDLLQKKANLTGADFNKGLKGEKYGGSVAFGSANAYGLDQDVSATSLTNYRFQDKVDEEDLPSVLKAKGDFSGWKTGDALNIDDDAVTSMKSGYFSPVYSGLSA